MAGISRPLRLRDRALPHEQIGSAGGARWFVAGIVLLGLTAMLPVLQKSMVTSRGFELQQHEADLARVNAEVHLLEQQVAGLMSQERIERRAGQIGLFPGQGAIYVQVSEPGPEPAKVPAELLAPATEEPQGSDPWWKPLVRWVPSLR
jgi:hypothetical protein